jgi:hypothetical protein
VAGVACKRGWYRQSYEGWRAAQLPRVAYGFFAFWVGNESAGRDRPDRRFNGSFDAQPSQPLAAVLVILRVVVKIIVSRR